MRIYRSLSKIPADLGRSVVTVGKFDGVHRGHAMVVKELTEVAERESLTSVVLTFDRNPMSLFIADKVPPCLTSVEQKLELLDRAGVDVVCVVPFDHEFAALSPDAFIADVLRGVLHADIVLVGGDFRFGHRGSGTVDSLRKAADASDWDLRIVDNFRLAGDDDKVSSSRIRELMGRGDVMNATQLLGRVPTLRGEIVHGLQRGRELGFPTANLARDMEGLPPGDGVYAGWLRDETGEAYAASISVGTNPTFGENGQRTIETYVPGRELYLYGQAVELGFVERLREQRAFDSVETLINQITDDVERTLDIVNANEDAPHAV